MKIADFGVAYQRNNKEITDYCCSRYAPPEIWMYFEQNDDDDEEDEQHEDTDEIQDEEKGILSESNLCCVVYPSGCLVEATILTNPGETVA